MEGAFFELDVLLHLWGPYACFTRPEMKAERVSYDVPTPSAVRGIFDALYWHTGVKWDVTDIWVRSPIRFMNIRRNELKCLLPAAEGLEAILEGRAPAACDADAQRTQRSSLILRDVDYYAKASMRVDPAVYRGGEAKAMEIVRRRLGRGGCYHRPYFGCKEFPAMFEAADAVPECPDCLRGEKDLGWMFLDWDYHDGDGGDARPEPRFFRASMADGHIAVPKGGLAG